MVGHPLFQWGMSPGVALDLTLQALSGDMSILGLDSWWVGLRSQLRWCNGLVVSATGRLGMWDWFRRGRIVIFCPGGMPSGVSMGSTARFGLASVWSSRFGSRESEVVYFRSKD